ncbi:MAG: FtsX-like permease family protein [Chloroflexi bacterium]|nr:FtsX-like permease family protein [Chloroflexota bacterium]
MIQQLGLSTAEKWMTILLILMGLALLYVVLMGLRRRIIFKMGLRNITRRPGQTALIVLGLTLSTVIIVSALSLGDTLTYSVRRHVVDAYGEIDQVISPPLLSTLAGLAAGAMGDEGGDDPMAALADSNLGGVLEGDLTSILGLLKEGLPGISEERYAQLRDQAQSDPATAALVDGVAPSIAFPTIIRDRTSGQGIPLGFIVAVNNEYDEQFGLTSVDGEPVQMEELRTGVGNIFAQAMSLFGWANSIGVNVESRAVGVAQVGALITQLQTESPDEVATADAVDPTTVPTTEPAASPTQPAATEPSDEPTATALAVTQPTAEPSATPAIESTSEATVDLTGETPDDQFPTLPLTETLDLSALGLGTVDLSTLSGAALTDTLVLAAMEETLGIDIDTVLSTMNLNTLGIEIDRVLEQVGLELRQGDVYLNRLGAEQLNAQPGDVLDIFIGPIPVPFRVRAIVEQSGPLGALKPVVMLRLDEAQELLFMPGRVNNVLVSNTGDAYTGMENTAGAARQLRALALNEAALTELVALLREPRVLAHIEAGADGSAPLASKPTSDSEELGDLLAFFTGGGSRIDLAERTPLLVAELARAGISQELRVLVAQPDMQSWLQGLLLPGETSKRLDEILGRISDLEVLDVLSKNTVVEVAAVGGTIFTTVFTIFGTFSIFAGVLLIFLIFVMLAAERRSEMGMARAIGMRRSHLVQMFVSEGMIYDLVAAALGIVLGLAVSYAMIGFLGGIFNTAAQQVSSELSSSLFTFHFNVAPTSVVIAYALGVLFTFAVVTLSSWRVSRLNIVSAVRDIPEPEGGEQGAGKLVGRLITGPLTVAVGVWICFGVAGGQSGTLLLIALSLVLAGGMLSVSWTLSTTSMRTERRRRLVYSVMGLGLVLLWGLPWERLLPGMGFGVLEQDAQWTLLSFIVKGPALILGGILIIMFSADTILQAVSRVLGGIGALAPVLKTAIAYPLSSRFRTGMAMVMFAMIITTVVLMSVVIQATQSAITLDAKSSAGFDISTSFGLLSFFDRVTDMEGELAQMEEFAQEDVAAVGAIVNPTVDARQAGADPTGSWYSLAMTGMDEGFMTQARDIYTFQQRAEGFESDAAVWQALMERDDVAIVSPSLVANPDSSYDSSGGSSGNSLTAAFGDLAEEASTQDEGRSQDGGQAQDGFNFRLTGFTRADDLPEVWLELRDRAGGQMRIHRVQVIGVLSDITTVSLAPVHVNSRAVAALTGKDMQPDFFFVKVAEGADVRQVAQKVERAFLSSALEAGVIADSVAKGQTLIRGILQLFQGFLALGLMVGIAALGVISSRTVVERRQEVGMLRAIGYQPGMITLSFVLEASFIALVGISLGTVTGILLGQAMIGQFFSVITAGRTLAVPWAQIGGIVLGAYLFSLLATILPAIQASRIYPADALRYE